MSKIYLKRVLALLLLVSLSNAYGADVVVTNSPTITGNSGLGHTTGQSFTATKTGVLTKIEVVLGGAGSGTSTLKIYDGAGVAGTLLYTKTGIDLAVDTVTSASDYTFHTITIDSTVSITNLGVYTFNLTPATAMDINYAGSNYGDGQMYVSEGAQSGFDMIFKVTQGDGAVTPTISAVTYDSSNGNLVVTGTNFEAKGGTPPDDISVSKLKITGEGGGGSEYTLTTADVERTGATSFTVALNAADKLRVDALLNKTSTAADDGTNYNLAVLDDFIANITAGDTAIATSAITVSNYVNPTITSATYDASSGALVVTGANMSSVNGATNDVVA
ncbi:MAG: hypothetical protein HRT35_31765, partial [Algicola sp.]|nr:hypothetical protein [Algicola sp.]